MAEMHNTVGVDKADSDSDSDADSVSSGVSSSDGGVGGQLLTRRGLLKAGAAAGAGAVVLGGVPGGAPAEFERFQAVDEADAALPLVPIVIAVAGVGVGMNGAVMIHNFFMDDADSLDDKGADSGKLRQYDTASARLRYADVARALASTETQYLTQRESSYNFDLTLSDYGVNIDAVGQSGTVDYIDTGWAEARAAIGSVYASGGSESEAVTEASRRARLTAASAACVTLENANSNYEALATTFTDQASRGVASPVVFVGGTAPAVAGGIPGGTTQITGDQANNDPVMIQIPLEVVDENGDPVPVSDLPDFSGDYTPSALAVWDGSNWVPSHPIGSNTSFSIPDSVNTGSIVTGQGATADVSGEHSELSQTAWPHVGESFNLINSQLLAARDTLLNRIPDLAANSKAAIEDGELKPADMIGARELVHRFADTTNFSRYAAELIGMGLSGPKDGSLETQVKIKHEDLAGIGGISEGSFSIPGTHSGETLAVIDDTTVLADDGEDVVKYDLSDGSASAVASATVSGQSGFDQIEVFDDGRLWVAIAATGYLAWGLVDGMTLEVDGVGSSYFTGLSYDPERSEIWTVGSTTDPEEAWAESDGTKSRGVGDVASGGDVVVDAKRDIVFFGGGNGEVSAFDLSDLTEPADWSGAEIYDTGACDSLQVTGDHMFIMGASFDGLTNQLPVAVDPDNGDVVHKFTEYEKAYETSSGADSEIVAGEGVAVFSRASSNVYGAVDLVNGGKFEELYSSEVDGVQYGGMDTFNSEVYLLDSAGEITVVRGDRAIAEEYSAVGHLFVDSNAVELSFTAGDVLEVADWDIAYLLTLPESGEFESVLLDSENGPIEILEVMLSDDVQDSADGTETESDKGTDDANDEGHDTEDGSTESEVDTDYYLDLPDPESADIAGRGDVVIDIVDMASGDVLASRSGADIVDLNADTDADPDHVLTTTQSYTDVRLEIQAGITTTKRVGGEQDPTDGSTITEDIQGLIDAVEEIEDARAKVAGGDGGSGDGISPMGVVAAVAGAAGLGWLISQREGEE